MKLVIELERQKFMMKVWYVVIEEFRGDRT